MTPTGIPESTLPEATATPAAVSAPAAWDEAAGPEERAPGETLNIDVAGFEGPLDLLLALARTQKVDLAQISILALVEQYLAFIAEVQKVRLELAADYLVMAAWLAFLKSRLLLPREEKPGDGARRRGAGRASRLPPACGSMPCARRRRSCSRASGSAATCSRAACPRA